MTFIELDKKMVAKGYKSEMDGLHLKPYLHTVLELGYIIYSREKDNIIETVEIQIFQYKMIYGANIERFLKYFEFNIEENSLQYLE